MKQPDVQKALKAALDYIDPIRRAQWSWTNGDIRRLVEQLQRAIEWHKGHPPHQPQPLPEELDTTNGRLARVLSDIEQLMVWALADYEASKENGYRDQAAHDRQRVRLLQQAQDCLTSIRR